jgi:peptide/nickel transport system ATP-binding protein
MSGEVVLTVEGLNVVLEGSEIDIDDDVSLSIRQGEVLGLVGESASGKTTAATSLLAHQRRGAKIAGGRIVIDGRDVLAMSAAELRAIRGNLISYVPQDSSASLNPALRISTQLTEILEAHGYGRSAAERRQRLAEMLEEVLLPHDEAFLRRYPHQLSGGQQQRVAIAMAFACRPKVIVLDEPTTALDVTTQAHVLDTIRELTRSYDVAALYVTHDLAVVANLADRIAVMYAGRLVEIGTREELFRCALHPYTRKLLAAIPDISGQRPLRGIPGWAPRPGQRPAGCAFAPRCELRIERCVNEYPPSEGPGRDHQVRCWRWAEVADIAQGDVVLWSRAQKSSGVATRPAISVRDLTAYHGSSETLHNINITLFEHRCLALVGESGSGKTTLARCIAGLHPFKIEGKITLAGEDLARDARSRPRITRQLIQYIFQSPYSSLNPRKTIRQILAQPLRMFFQLDKDQMEQRMVKVLEQVALDPSLLSRYPDQLSGGERQRIAIARALAAEPAALICDEVTSWLDVSVQASVIELLAALQAETGVSMLFVTHNMALIRSISQDVAVMNKGRIVELGVVDEVLENPQADYTRKLLTDTLTV